MIVHPRTTHTRVDAVRSSRVVRVELDGVVLAETSAPVLLFKTGLPTRCYVPRGHLNFERLARTNTVTECPYQGTTSAYWSGRVGEDAQPDLAWSFDFPTRQLLPIAEMAAFSNERVDHVVGGAPLEHPRTHFFR